MKKKQGKVIQKVKGWISYNCVKPIYLDKGMLYCSVDKLYVDDKHVEITVREI